MFELPSQTSLRVDTIDPSRIDSEGWDVHAGIMRGVVTGLTIQDNAMRVHAHGAQARLHAHVYAACEETPNLIPLNDSTNNTYFVPIDDGLQTLEVAARYTYGGGQLPFIGVYMRNSLPVRMTHERLADRLVSMLGLHSLRAATGGPQAVAFAIEFADHDTANSTYDLRELRTIERRLSQ